MPPRCAAYAVPPRLPEFTTAIVMLISAMNTTSHFTFIGTTPKNSTSSSGHREA